MLTLEAGVSEKKYSSVFDEEMKLNDLYKLHSALKDIRDTVYQAAWEIKRTAPQSVWDHYKLLEVTDLPHQIRLEACFKNIRKEWVYVKTIKKKKSNNTDQVKEDIEQLSI